MNPRRLLAVLAAALLGAAAGQVAPAPADAAGGYCTAGTGVTVVVDYGSLGAGTSVGCDPRDARVTGSTVVARAGYSLTYVARQPGFVCRVNGLPAPSRESCGTTPPQNAYWGLFWSDGRSGRWTYASVGIGSLKVPAGGFIGWRFQGGTRAVPRPAPVSPRPAGPKPRPKPTPRPTPRPTSRPTPGPTSHPTRHATHRPHHPTPPPTHQASNQASHRPSHRATHQPAASATAPAGTAKAAAPSTGTSTRTASRSAKASAGRSPSSIQTAGTTAPSSAGTSATAQPSATAAAAGSLSGSTSPSPAAATTGTDLQSGEQATGSPAALPLVAGTLAVLLLGSAGVVAYRRRRSE